MPERNVGIYLSGAYGDATLEKDIAELSAFFADVRRILHKRSTTLYTVHGDRPNAPEDICKYDLCVFLFNQKVPDAERKLLTDVRQTLLVRADGKPKVLTWFRGDNHDAQSNEINELKNFLDEEVGHFWSPYLDVDSIKLQILLELEEQGFSLPAATGTCYRNLDGKVILDIADTAFYKGNKRIADLAERVAAESARFEELLDLQDERDLTPNEEDELDDFTDHRNALEREQVGFLGEVRSLLSSATNSVSSDALDRRIARLCYLGRWSDACALLDSAVTTGAVDKGENALLAGEELASEGMRNIQLGASRMLTRAQALDAQRESRATDVETQQILEAAIQVESAHDLEPRATCEYGRILVRRGLYNKAIDLLTESCDWFRRHASNVNATDSAEWRRHRANALQLLISAQRLQGDRRNVAETVLEYCDIQKGLLGPDSSEEESHTYAGILEQAALVLSALGETDRAGDLAQEALERRANVYKYNHGVSAGQELAHSYKVLSQIACDSSNLEAARGRLEEQANVLGRLYGENPTRELATAFARSFTDLSKLARLMRDKNSRLLYAEQATKVLRNHFGEHPYPSSLNLDDCLHSELFVHDALHDWDGFYQIASERIETLCNQVTSLCGQEGETSLETILERLIGVLHNPLAWRGSSSEGKRIFEDLRGNPRRMAAGRLLDTYRNAADTIMSIEIGSNLNPSQTRLVGRALEEALIGASMATGIIASREDAESYLQERLGALRQRPADQRDSKNAYFVSRGILAAMTCLDDNSPQVQGLTYERICLLRASCGTQRVLDGIPTHLKLGDYANAEELALALSDGSRHARSEGHVREADAYAADSLDVLRALWWSRMDAHSTIVLSEGLCRAARESTGDTINTKSLLDEAIESARALRKRSEDEDNIQAYIFILEQVEKTMAEAGCAWDIGKAIELRQACSEARRELINRNGSPENVRECSHGMWTDAHALKRLGCLEEADALLQERREMLKELCLEDPRRYLASLGRRNSSISQEVTTLISENAMTDEVGSVFDDAIAICREAHNEKVTAYAQATANPAADDTNRDYPIDYAQALSDVLVLCIHVLASMRRDESLVSKGYEQWTVNKARDLTETCAQLYRDLCDAEGQQRFFVSNAVSLSEEFDWLASKMRLFGLKDEAERLEAESLERLRDAQKTAPRTRVSLVLALALFNRYERLRGADSKAAIEYLESSLVVAREYAKRNPNDRTLQWSANLFLKAMNEYFHRPLATTEDTLRNLERSDELLEEAMGLLDMPADGNVGRRPMALEDSYQRMARIGIHHFQTRGKADVALTLAKGLCDRTRDLHAADETLQTARWLEQDLLYYINVLESQNKLLHMSPQPADERVDVMVWIWSRQRTVALCRDYKAAAAKASWCHRKELDSLREQAASEIDPARIALLKAAEKEERDLSTTCHNQQLAALRWGAENAGDEDADDFRLDLASNLWKSVSHGDNADGGTRKAARFSPKKGIALADEAFRNFRALLIAGVARHEYGFKRESAMTLKELVSEYRALAKRGSDDYASIVDPSTGAMDMASVAAQFCSRGKSWQKVLVYLDELIPCLREAAYSQHTTNAVHKLAFHLKMASVAHHNLGDEESRLSDLSERTHALSDLFIQEQKTNRAQECWKKLVHALLDEAEALEESILLEGSNEQQDDEDSSGDSNMVEPHLEDALRCTGSLIELCASRLENVKQGAEVANDVSTIIGEIVSERARAYRMSDRLLVMERELLPEDATEDIPDRRRILLEGEVQDSEILRIAYHDTPSLVLAATSELVDAHVSLANHYLSLRRIEETAREIESAVSEQASLPQERSFQETERLARLKEGQSKLCKLRAARASRLGDDAKAQQLREDEDALANEALNLRRDFHKVFQTNAPASISLAKALITRANEIEDIDSAAALVNEAHTVCKDASTTEDEEILPLARVAFEGAKWLTRHGLRNQGRNACLTSASILEAGWTSSPSYEMGISYSEALHSFTLHYENTDESITGALEHEKTRRTVLECLCKQRKDKRSMRLLGSCIQVLASTFERLGNGTDARKVLNEYLEFARSFEDEPLWAGLGTEQRAISLAELAKFDERHGDGEASCNECHECIKLIQEADPSVANVLRLSKPLKKANKILQELSAPELVELSFEPIDLYEKAWQQTRKTAVGDELASLYRTRAEALVRQGKRDEAIGIAKKRAKLIGTLHDEGTSVVYERLAAVSRALEFVADTARNPGDNRKAKRGEKTATENGCSPCTAVEFYLRSISMDFLIDSEEGVGSSKRVKETLEKLRECSNQLYWLSNSSSDRPPIKPRYDRSCLQYEAGEYGAVINEPYTGNRNPICIKSRPWNASSEAAQAYYRVLRPSHLLLLAFDHGDYDEKNGPTGCFVDLIDLRSSAEEFTTASNGRLLTKKEREERLGLLADRLERAAETLTQMAVESNDEGKLLEAVTLRCERLDAYQRRLNLHPSKRYKSALLEAYDALITLLGQSEYGAFSFHEILLRLKKRRFGISRSTIEQIGERAEADSMTREEFFHHLVGQLDSIEANGNSLNGNGCRDEKTKILYEVTSYLKSSGERCKRYVDEWASHAELLHDVARVLESHGLHREGLQCAVEAVDACYQALTTTPIKSNQGATRETARSRLGDAASYVDTLLASMRQDNAITVTLAPGETLAGHVREMHRSYWQSKS